MSFLNNRIIWSALLSKKVGRKPDHTRSNCSGEEEIIGKFMWFTPFNIQLKVGVDLPDTLNDSVSHDLVTEKFCNKKNSVDVCSTFNMWVHKQSHCPLVETCFWQWQLDLKVQDLGACCHVNMFLAPKVCRQWWETMFEMYWTRN